MENENKQPITGHANFVILEHAINFVTAHGAFKVVFVAFVMLVLSLVGYLILNPDKVFKALFDYQQRVHVESIQKRMAQSAVITALVDDLRKQCGGVRAAVVEFHNGRSNTAGLSFNFAAMTYESVRDGYPSIYEDFAEFSIDRFTFIPQICKTGYWSGTLKDMGNTDKAFAHKIAVGGAHWLAIVPLYGKNVELGIMWISFAEGDKYDERQVYQMLTKYAAKVTPHIDNELN